MINIIVATHGKLAEGLVDSAKMFVGETEKLDYLSFERNMGIEELNEVLDEKMKGFSEENQLLFFCDIIGGSPFNVCSKYSFNNENIAVFYGVNLPILVEAILSREGKNLNELTSSLADFCKDSIGLSEL